LEVGGGIAALNTVVPAAVIRGGWHLARYVTVSGEVLALASTGYQYDGEADRLAAKGYVGLVQARLHSPRWGSLVGVEVGVSGGVGAVYASGFVNETSEFGGAQDPGPWPGTRLVGWGAALEFGLDTRLYWRDFWLGLGGKLLGFPSLRNSDYAYSAGLANELGLSARQSASAFTGTVSIGCSL